VARGYGFDCAKRHRLPYGVDGIVPSTRTKTERQRAAADARRVLGVKVPADYDRRAASDRYFAGQGSTRPRRTRPTETAAEADERWATFERAMGRR
jgi:hypothetical protein